MQGHPFAIWDVAGQKLERFRYTYSGEVTAIVFVVSLLDFEGGLTLVEDPNTDRIDDTLKLFELIATKFFPDHPIILLLNKVDKFQSYAKAGRYANASTFASLPAEDKKNPAKLAQVVKDMFIARAPTLHARNFLHSFETTGINKANMKEILKRIEHIVLTKNLDNFFGD